MTSRSRDFRVNFRYIHPEITTWWIARSTGERKKEQIRKEEIIKYQTNLTIFYCYKIHQFFTPIFRSNFLAAHLDSYQRVNSLMHSNEILLIPTIKQTKTIFTGYKQRQLFWIGLPTARSPTILIESIDTADLYTLLNTVTCGRATAAKKKAFSRARGTAIH